MSVLHQLFLDKLTLNYVWSKHTVGRLFETLLLLNLMILQSMCRFYLKPLSTLEAWNRKHPRIWNDHEMGISLGNLDGTRKNPFGLYPLIGNELRSDYEWKKNLSEIHLRIFHFERFSLLIICIVEIRINHFQANPKRSAVKSSPSNNFEYFILIFALGSRIWCWSDSIIELWYLQKRRKLLNLSNEKFRDKIFDTLSHSNRMWVIDRYRFHQDKEKTLSSVSSLLFGRKTDVAKACAGRRT